MYLVDDGLTAGWCLPKPARSMTVLLPSELRPLPPRAPSPPAPDRPLPVAIPTGVPALADFRPVRSAMPHGLKLITERRPGTGTVALDLFVDAGQLREAR